MDRRSTRRRYECGGARARRSPRSWSGPSPAARRCRRARRLRRPQWRAAGAARAAGWRRAVCARRRRCAARCRRGGRRRGSRVVPSAASSCSQARRLARANGTRYIMPRAAAPCRRALPPGSMSPRHRPAPAAATRSSSIGTAAAPARRAQPMPAPPRQQPAVLDRRPARVAGADLGCRSCLDAPVGVKSAGFRCGVQWLASHRVLRVPGEDSRHSHNDHDGFGLHRVLREVPGHSRQHGRLRRRRRGAPPFTAPSFACHRRPRS